MTAGRVMDTDLLIRFNSGEAAAFSEVYQHWMDDLFYFCCKFVDTADAEDVTAITFQKLWPQTRQFISLDHLRASLHTIARNECLNFIKSNARRTRRETAFESGEAQQDRPSGLQEETFDREAYLAALMQQLDEAIDRLPPQTARIFRLAWIDGRTNAEIARLLGIGEHSVRNQKSIALKTLRLQLAALLFFLCAG